MHGWRVSLKSSVAIVALVALATAGSAGAADIPVRAPTLPAYRAPAAVVVSTWTGCYVGGHTGVGWSHKSYFDPVTGIDQGSHSPSGFAGGFQAGCDYQVGAWVVGIQGMFDLTEMRSDHVLLSDPTLWEETHVRWFGTLTGRLGYAVLAQGLLYVKLGAAGVGDNHGESVVASSVSTGSTDITRLGWTAGVGWEFKFTPNWSAFVEYNYLGFGTRTVTFTPVGSGRLQYDIRQNVQHVGAGINYRF